MKEIDYANEQYSAYMVMWPRKSYITLLLFEQLEFRCATDFSRLYKFLQAAVNVA